MPLHIVTEEIEESGFLRRFVQNVLERQIWQFVSVLVGVIAISLAIYFDVRNNETKELTISILGSTSLVQVNGGAAERSAFEEIEVYYKNQRVDDLSLLLISIHNSGTQEILKVDFERPLIVDFPIQTKVFEVVVLEAYPNSLRVDVDAYDNHVSLAPLLLNQNDQIVLQLLVMDFPLDRLPDNMAVDTRIAGIYDIAVINDSKTENDGPITFNLLAVFNIVQFFVILGILVGRRFSNRLFDRPDVEEE